MGKRMAILKKNKLSGEKNGDREWCQDSAFGQRTCDPPKLGGPPLALSLSQWLSSTANQVCSADTRNTNLSGRPSSRIWKKCENIEQRRKPADGTSSRGAEKVKKMKRPWKS